MSNASNDKLWVLVADEAVAHVHALPRPAPRCSRCTP